MIHILSTSIQGVFVIEPRVHTDSRGYFLESFSQRALEQVVGDIRFVQDSESYSKYGTIRGLHYQKSPFAQSKLVRVVWGSVLDVAVDIRQGSPTLGQYVAVELSAQNKRQMFIPKGFAHGFVVLSPEAIFQYKCDNYYAPDYQGYIRWDDPTLGIDWKIPPQDVILSDKDQKSPSFKACEFYTP